MFKLHVIAMFC